MKIEIDLDDDWTDGLVAKVLAASIQRTREFGDEPEYDKRYIEAAQVVLEHFGIPK